MSQDISWNSEQDEILIDLVKNRELIYNVKCKEYRKGQLKQNVWREIAAILNKTGMTIANITTIDAGNTTIQDNDKDETDVVEKNTFKNLKEDDVQNNITPEEFQNNIYDSGPQKGHNLQLSKKRKASSNSDERLKLLKQIVDQQRLKLPLPEDETDLFFASMAKIVKKLPECERVRLRMEIDILVGSSELKYLMRINDIRPTSTATTSSSSSSNDSLSDVVSPPSLLDCAEQTSNEAGELFNSFMFLK
ncbi:hypothetical protein FQA39_LY02560 [Lamprigera yunnana]|nr:hypothetical protein FQA39_LY02560 [Lamprigera yunnana]